MLALLRYLFSVTPHLKASTLDAVPKYYLYTDEGWQPINWTQFDQLINSGRFYKHESACWAQEIIYNRKRVGADNSDGINPKN